MNLKQNNSKRTKLMAVVIVAVIASTMMIGFINQNLHNSMALADQPTSKNTQPSPVSINATSTKVINPSKSTDKEFWINTVHLDGMTNIHAAMKCDTCPQNIPLHPAEQPPANSSVPAGGGFRITEPNKAGAWDFRSFTFVPDQIVVNHGDKVTLHFVGVQGVHHVITVDSIGTFPLMRGQIHTVSFIAKSPGIINYTCHIHVPNMVGQILVLPKTT
jgi:plastocyanin